MGFTPDPTGELIALPRPPGWIQKKRKGGKEYEVDWKKGGREREGKRTERQEGRGKKGGEGKRRGITRSVKSLRSGKPFAASGGDLVDLASGFSNIEMTWLLYCTGAVTVQKCMKICHFSIGTSGVYWAP